MKKIRKSIQFTPHNKEFSLRLLCKEIGAWRMLTQDEASELMDKSLDGDNEAQEILVNCNLRLVYHIALHYFNSIKGTKVLTEEDIVAEGLFGLVKTTRRKTWISQKEKGVPFSRFATFGIQSQIVNFIYQTGHDIKLPVSCARAIEGLNYSREAVESMNDGYSDDSTVREFFYENYHDKIRTSIDQQGTNPSKVKVTATDLFFLDKPSFRIGSPSFQARNPEYELDFFFNPEDSLFAEEGYSPDFQMIKESLEKDLLRVIKTLTERKCDVLCMSYGITSVFKERLEFLLNQKERNQKAIDRYVWIINQHRGLELDEIGTYLDLTRERVRQLKQSAINDLRREFRFRLIRDYLTP